jgi:hypothetical protein
MHQKGTFTLSNFGADCVAEAFFATERLLECYDRTVVSKGYVHIIGLAIYHRVCQRLPYCIISLYAPPLYLFHRCLYDYCVSK